MVADEARTALRNFLVVDVTGFVDIPAHLHPLLCALCWLRAWQVPVAVSAVSRQAMRTLAAAASDQVRAKCHGMAIGGALSTFVDIDAYSADSREAGSAFACVCARLVDAVRAAKVTVVASFKTLIYV